MLAIMKKIANATTPMNHCMTYPFVVPAYGKSVATTVERSHRFRLHAPYDSVRYAAGGYCAITGNTMVTVVPSPTVEEIETSSAMRSASLRTR
jgi:hypothetical protein